MKKERITERSPPRITESGLLRADFQHAVCGCGWCTWEWCVCVIGACVVRKEFYLFFQHVNTIYTWKNNGDVSGTRHTTSFRVIPTVKQWPVPEVPCVQNGDVQCILCAFQNAHPCSLSITTIMKQWQQQQQQQQYCFFYPPGNL